MPIPFEMTKTATQTEFYTWQDYRCAYELHYPAQETTDTETPLLLIHPIGVGLSRQFWQRFCGEWYKTGCPNPIYNPDLLGCGESDLPRVAYTPTNWANQLQQFIQTVVQKPVIIVVQGASLPIAIALAQKQFQPGIRGLVLAGPPAWEVITQESRPWKQRLAWNLFNSPFGNAFYRYARRREFLRSFSERQLFAQPEAVDQAWLDTLKRGAIAIDTRHAVFSFLAGFWRQNYQEAIAAISPPTLVVVGDYSSSISRLSTPETPKQRLESYQQHLPNAQGKIISGRNVLPYESTAEFASVVAEFVSQTSEFSR